MANPESGRLRILQVAGSLYDWGGIERYVVYLSDGLAGRGHEVHVTAPYQSPLAKKLHAQTWHIEQKGKYRLGPLRHYLKLFKRFRYDVIHVHFSPDFFVPMLAAKLRKQPLRVMTRHVALPWSKVKVQQNLKLITHIIAVSDAVRNELLRSGVPPGRVTTAKAGCPPLAPMLPEEMVRERLGLDERAFAIGIFGRLVEEKGCQFAVEAMTRLPETVVLEIFGEGPQEAALQKLAAGNGRIRLRGFVPDVADKMAAMDLVAIPSTWAEAFPYAALEAMSLGKPILASAVGGLPEIVEDGFTGKLCLPKSAESFAEAVLELMQKPEQLLGMGLEAQKRHREHYTVPKMAERIEAVYRACGAGHGSL